MPKPINCASVKELNLLKKTGESIDRSTVVLIWMVGLFFYSFVNFELIFIINVNFVKLTSKLFLNFRFYYISLKFLNLK